MLYHFCIQKRKRKHQLYEPSIARIESKCQHKVSIIEESRIIETLTDYPNDKIPPGNKGKTPAVKQAKRDRDTKERWKKKATQKSIEINAQKKKGLQRFEKVEKSQ